jgi:hypothetical protein
LSSCWSPVAAVKQDGDGTNPTPVLELHAQRGFDHVRRRWIQSWGTQKWRLLYLDYDLRDAAPDNPTITVSYSVTPTGSYTALSPVLAETTDQSRRAGSSAQATAPSKASPCR